VTPPAPPAKAGPAPMTSMGFAVDSMEKATVHDPIGKPGGPGLWHHKGKQLPAYIQHVAKALMKGGMAESHAIATAVNTIKRWAAGGGDVHPDTRAAAAKALAEWEAAKAETHLAVQTGSVPVRSSGDGPRVTGNTTAKGAFLVAYTRGRRRRARSRRSMAIEASSPGHCDSVECLTAKDPVCTCECGGVGHMKGIGALGHPSKQKRPLKATVVTKPEKKAPPPDPWSDPEGASKGLSPGSWGGDDPMAQDAAFEAWAAKSQVAAAKEKIKAAKAPKLEAIAKKAAASVNSPQKTGGATPYLSEQAAVALHKAVNTNLDHYVPVDGLKPSGKATHAKPTGDYFRLTPTGQEFHSVGGVETQVDQAMVNAKLSPHFKTPTKKAPVKKQKASKVGAPSEADTAKAAQVAALPASHNLTEAEVMAHYKANVTATHGEKMALDSYTGSGYANMNRKLRSGKIDEMTAQEKGRMFELDNLAAKYTLPATTKVSRGISSQYFTKETLAPGSIYTDPGFVSTSHSTEFGGNIKFKITVPKGMKAISVNAHGVGIHSEHELILPRGTKFAVTSDTGYTGGSYRTIHMTAIPA
jgi:hypothetical protein